ncbi:MAG TPA: hypothetical protein VFA66_01750 [Gaiellaceae bacterium]|nr:hypothetical protein [Gaiellaceae bacterium]
MRTTVTLDPDVEALVRRLMRERSLSFKEAVNQAIRTGLSRERKAEPARTPTFRMGFQPTIPWDKALRIAGELEDDELTRRLAARK